jgi:hypothetical protein
VFLARVRGEEVQTDVDARLATEDPGACFKCVEEPERA